MRQDGRGAPVLAGFDFHIINIFENSNYVTIIAMKILSLLKWEMAAEAQRWIDQGIIAREQGEKILSLYGTQLPDAKRHLNIGYLAISAIGVLFFGIALIIFIGHNWEEFSRGLRMGFLIALVIVSGGIGLWIRKAKPAESNLVFFANAFIFGAAIFLIAQVYHLGAYFPDGILLWIAGVVPLVVFTRSLLLHFLLAFLALLWLVTDSIYGHVPFLFIPLAAFGFWYCIKKNSSLVIYACYLTGCIYFMEVVVSSIIYPNDFSLDVEHIYLTGGIFILLFIFSHHLEGGSRGIRIQDYSTFTHVWCVRFGLITLFVFSYETMWAELIHQKFQAPYFQYYMAGVVLIPSAISLWVRVRHDFKLLFSQYLSETTALILFTVFCIATPLALTSDAMVFALTVNALLFAIGVYMIRKGVTLHLSSYYYIGIAIILLMAVLRYVDLIGDYIGSTLIFLSASIAAFVAARYWKKTMEEKS